VSHRVEDFRPGDFTVTPVIDGFVVGKVLPRSAIGPWWTLVETVTDETDAIREAVTRALTAGSRVWFQEGPGRFRLVDTSAAAASWSSSCKDHNPQP
jgi:hypothetical protein